MINLYIPSTVTRTLTTLCPAGLSALIIYRPLWVRLLTGMVTTDVVPEERICKEQQVKKHFSDCSWAHLLKHVEVCIVLQALNGLTSESTGRVWRSFFFSVSAVPSKVQVTLGRGLPVMVAGILMVVAALQFSKSCALTSRVTVGSTGKKTSNTRRAQMSEAKPWLRPSVCCTYSECLESGSLPSVQVQSFQQHLRHRS